MRCLRRRGPSPRRTLGGAKRRGTRPVGCSRLTDVILAVEMVIGSSSFVSSSARFAIPAPGINPSRPALTRTRRAASVSTGSKTTALELTLTCPPTAAPPPNDARCWIGRLHWCGRWLRRGLVLKSATQEALTPAHWSNRAPAPQVRHGSEESFATLVDGCGCARLLSPRARLVRLVTALRRRCCRSSQLERSAIAGGDTAGIYFLVPACPLSYLTAISEAWVLLVGSVA